ncbi:hypothetical protein V1514DRAFT_344952 [Lipomyces japonicus]|uniref:uncharacterized protein n=1 Tax=Lipomyces japonicus TaxID=56871 RepID=UPI0034CFF928
MNQTLTDQPKSTEVAAIAINIAGKKIFAITDTGCSTYVTSEALCHALNIPIVPLPNPQRVETASPTLAQAQTLDNISVITFQIGDREFSESFYVKTGMYTSLALEPSSMNLNTLQMTLRTTDSYESCSTKLSRLEFEHEITTTPQPAGLSSIRLGEQMSNAQREQTQGILAEFQDVFSDAIPLGRVINREVSHRIPLTDDKSNTPPYRGIYRLYTTELTCEFLGHTVRN